MEREDGGGPWFTLDYTDRKHNVKLATNGNGKVYGCISKEELMRYFNNKIPYLCHIQEYEIPVEDIKIINKMVEFPIEYVYKRLKAE